MKKLGAVEKEQANKTLLPDFGTYHHTTGRNSERLRERVKILFNETLDDLPFPRRGELKILDIGCGLGFLSCVCAEHYPKATVTGIDTFEHASLKDSSLVKAKNNTKILGLSDRIRFERKDFFRSDYSRAKIDLFVSNLVFHNFGNKKKHLDAYERLARWAGSKSYIVLADVFFDYEADLRGLANLFDNVEERPEATMGGQYKMLLLSEPKK